MVEIVSPGDMILSRTRAPLIKQAYSFLREEKKAVILGTDIGSHLESFIKKFNAADVQSLRKKLDEYEEKQTERLSGNKSSIMQLSLLKDRCECVRILMHNCDKISEVITKVHRLFVDEDDKTQRAGAIILATVHKAKGLEAKNVFVIEPSKIPHPLAKRQHQIEEESHIAYVAVTRAKETIRFVGPIPSIFGDGFVAPVPEPEPVYNPPVETNSFDETLQYCKGIHPERFYRNDFCGSRCYDKDFQTSPQVSGVWKVIGYFSFA